MLFYFLLSGHFILQLIIIKMNPKAVKTSIEAEVKSEGKADKL